MSAGGGNILVIRGGAIGDFILTLPVLSALRTAFPQTRLAVLGYPHVAQLASASGLADEVRSIESRPLAGFFAAGGKLDPSLADFFSEFDLIISYLYDPDRIFEENVWRCSGAQFIAGPHRPDESLGMHASATFLKPLERLAIYQADPRPKLRFAESKTLQPPGQWVAVHPGSGSESKNWPLSRWEKFLERLATHDIRLLLVSGEAEGERIATLARRWPTDRLALAMRLPLIDLAQKLQECRAFIGHDSGISHLAAAIGLPALLLWGPSNATIWQPQSPALTICRGAHGLHALTEEEVEEKFLRIWNSPGQSRSD